MGAALGIVIIFSLIGVVRVPLGIPSHVAIMSNTMNETTHECNTLALLL